MIVAISDLHLGYSESNRDDIDHFLDSSLVRNLSKSDHFVLAGDGLDFWRTNSVTALIRNDKTVRKILDLQRTTNLHYLVGNHDYLMGRFAERAGDVSYRSFDLRQSLRLSDGGKSFFFVHGYELEVLASLWPLTIENYEKIAYRMCYQRTLIGRFLSLLGGLSRPLKSRAPKTVRIMLRPEDRKELSKVDELAKNGMAHVIYGLSDDEILVFGHTHRPIPPTPSPGSVINLGSWVHDSPGCNKYLVIKNGAPTLKQFP